MLVKCVCNGAPRCALCSGTGQVAITKCPAEMVPAGIWRARPFIDFANAGDWPKGGGVLENTQSFMDLIEQWRTDLAYWKPPPPPK